MLYTLPALVKGANTVQVYQVVFDEDSRTLFVRGRYGTEEGGVFTADPDLAEVVRTVSGESYDAAIAASGLREQFAAGLLAALFGAA